MQISIKLLFFNIIKTVYLWAVAILCGLPAFVYPYFIKPLLKDKYQITDMTAILIYIIILLFSIILASFIEFHKLRSKRINELYDFIPEAKGGKIFRDIYELYKLGKVLKDTNTERRQKWDEDVIRGISKYFKANCLNNYLISTGRMFAPPRYTPLDDNKYNDAVLYVKELLDNDSSFNNYLKN